MMLEPLVASLLWSYVSTMRYLVLSSGVLLSGGRQGERPFELGG